MVQKINDINLSRLRNGVHYDGVSAIIEMAEGDAAVSAKANAQVLVLKKKLATEDECLKISQKNKKSDEIAEQDHLRDDCYTSIREIVLAMTRVPDDETQEAAEDVMQSLKDYNISVRDKLIDQTGKMTNLVADFETKLATQVEKLGLTQLVAKLKAANDSVHSLMVERNAENGAKVAGALKAARDETDTAYYNLVEKVNALCVVDGENDYTSFINSVNEEIKKLKQTLSRKSDDDGGDDTTAES